MGDRIPPLDPDAWKPAGLCRTMDPLLWMPRRNEGETNRGEQGKAVCARCPVVLPCLLASIFDREKAGVWGGAGEPTRRRLSRMTRGRGREAHPPSCTCTFCIATREHVAQLAVAFDGDEPRHGTWQAFLHAGCRCTPCTVAYRATGRALPQGPPPST